MVMGAEFLVDWIKHAFITRFNEVDADVYKSYTIFLAYDLAQTKQKHVSLSFILERSKNRLITSASLPTGSPYMYKDAHNAMSVYF